MIGRSYQAPYIPRIEKSGIHPLDSVCSISNRIEIITLLGLQLYQNYEIKLGRSVPFLS